MLTVEGGDQLFIDLVRGRLGKPNEQGKAKIQFVTEFTGGTGRFVNATGGFKGKGRFDATAGEFCAFSGKGKGKGRISKPAVIDE